jgi:DNA-binding PadR family transcriptional regulator
LARAARFARRLICYELTAAGRKEIEEARFQIARLYGFRPDQLMALDDTRKELGIND